MADCRLSVAFVSVDDLRTGDHLSDESLKKVGLRSIMAASEDAGRSVVVADHFSRDWSR